MAQDLKKLQKLWAKKLKDDGFEDIEKDEEHLKQFSIVDTRYGGPVEAKVEYYQLATNFLSDYEFDSRFEYAVWMYHAEGISIRNIAKILNRIKKKYKMKSVYRRKIWVIVNRLETEMKKKYGIIR